MSPDNKPKSLFITLDDESIVYAINRPLMLEASAGSGKTTMLTERYLACLFYLLGFERLSPWEAVRSIVAITYTKKAAAEIRDRIRKKLAECLNKEYLLEMFVYLSRYSDTPLPDPEGAAGAILTGEDSLLNALNDAPISTIHAYGFGLLKKYPVEAEIDPSVRISAFAENESNLPIGIEAAHQAVTKLMRENSRRFALLVSLIGINETMDFIATIRKTADDRGFGEFETRLRETGYLEYADKLASIEIADLPDFVRSKTGAHIDGILGLCRRLAADEKKPPQGVTALLARLSGADPSRIEHLIGLKYEPTSKSEKSDKTAIQNSIRDAVLALSFEIHKILFAFILPVLREIYDTYFKLKLERRELLFSDIETLLDGVLARSVSLAECVRRNVRYFLIDEFQDTSDIQKRIFYALLFGGKSAPTIVPFIVGDPKQSIYSFRNANVAVFRETAEDFARRFGPDSVKYLRKNFRSVPALVNNINTVFSNLFDNPASGGIEYQPQIPGGDKTGTGDFYFVRSSHEGGRETKPAQETNYRNAARLVRALVENKKYKPGDILILLNKTTTPQKTLIPIFRELLPENIPFVFADKRNLLDDDVIRDIVIYLRALDRPGSDYHFAALLKSPFFRLDDGTLLSLRNDARKAKSSLYDALLARGGEDILFFESLVKIKSKLDISSLVRRIVDETGYMIYLYSLPDGKSHATAVMLFLNFIESIKTGEIYNLTQFIYYLQTNKPELAFPKLFGEVCDVVRIMTVHSMKGLQAKAVIYIATSAYNPPVDILTGDEPGCPKIGFDLIARDRNYVKLKERSDAKNHAEQIRLAYVALTRACDDFFYLGFMNDGRRTIDAWAEIFRTGTRPELEKFIRDKETDIDSLIEKFSSGDLALNVRRDVSRLADDWADRLLSSPLKPVSPLLPAVITISQLLDMEFAASEFKQKYIIKSYPIGDMIDSLEIEEGEIVTAAGRAEIGTFMHGVFQFAKPSDYTAYIDATGEEMGFEDKRTREELLRLAGIYFGSELYKHYFTAPEWIRHEWEFNYPFAHTRYTPLVKGTADCFIRSGGRGVLIDYKLSVTDTRRYSRQLGYYALLLGKMGYPADELLLYDIENGTSIPAEYDPALTEKKLAENIEAIVDEFMGAFNNRRIPAAR
ncbi:MAG: hypothetical protein A2Y33_06195 [Spirochaetes bacterium GWF1_51_8]|nr:MAG: hypothetical protein A2Y33_06195 [Spirochaetes bacterium GWF1_51_8]